MIKKKLISNLLNSSTKNSIKTAIKTCEEYINDFDNKKARLKMQDYDKKILLYYYTLIENTDFKDNMIKTYNADYKSDYFFYKAMESSESIYNNINEAAQKFDGNRTFTEIDTLKIPNISFDEKQEYKELEGKPFFFSDGREYYIDKALQTIKFELDNEGGSIKSEAGMMTKESVAIMPEEERNFNFDDEFTIFLKEKDKSKPYFSALITDITEFQ